MKDWALLIIILCFSFFKGFSQEILIPDARSNTWVDVLPEVFIHSNRERLNQLSVILRKGDTQLVEYNGRIALGKGRNSIDLFQLSRPLPKFLAGKRIRPGVYHLELSCGNVQTQRTFKIKARDLNFKVIRNGHSDNTSYSILCNDYFDIKDLGELKLLFYSPLSKNAQDSVIVTSQTTIIVQDSLSMDSKHPYQIELHLVNDGLIGISKRKNVLPVTELNRISGLQFKNTDILGTLNPDSTGLLSKRNISLYGSHEIRYSQRQSSSRKSSFGQMHHSIGIDYKEIPLQFYSRSALGINNKVRLVDYGVKFDFDRFKESLKKRAQEQIKANKNSLLKKDIPLDFDTTKLDNLESLKNQLLHKVENAAGDSIHKEIRDIEKQIVESENAQKLDSLRNSGVSKRDSIENLKEINFRDSISSIDTLNNLKEQLRKLREKKSMIDSIHQKIDKAKTRIQKLDKIHNDYMEIPSQLRKTSVEDYSIKNAEDLATLLPINNPKVISVISNIKEFSIGTDFIHISENTVNSKDFRGTNLTYELGDFEIKYAGGQISDGLQLLNETRINYSHNFNLFKIKRSYGEKTSVSVGYVNFESSETNPQVYENKVSFLAVEQELTQWVDLRGEISRSKLLSRQNIAFNDGIELNNSIEHLLNIRDLDNQAMEVSLNLFGDKGNQEGIRISYMRIGSAYKSLGAPFLFNDREGYKLSLRKSLFSEKLLFSGSLMSQFNNRAHQQAESAQFTHLNSNIFYRAGKKLHLSFSMSKSYIRQFEFEQNSLTVNLNTTFQEKIGSVRSIFQAAFFYQENAALSSQSMENSGISTSVVLYSLKGNSFQISSSIPLKSTILNSKQAQIEFSFNEFKRLSLKAFGNYFNSAIYGENLIYGTGVQYSIKNLGLINLKLGKNTMNPFNSEYRNTSLDFQFTTRINW